MTIEQVTIVETINDKVVKALRRKAQSKAQQLPLGKSEAYLFNADISHILDTHVGCRAVPLGDPYVDEYRDGGYTVYARIYAGDPDEDFEL